MTPREYELGPVRVISLAFWQTVPPGEMLLDGLSTRPCVRLRMWVTGNMSHEEFRQMVREVQRR